MKAISSVIRKQNVQDGFPILHVNGYGGEQDGTSVLLSDVFRFSSRVAADEEFPDGVPDYVKLHWAHYHPGRGWEAVFGCWSDQPKEGDGNPLRME